MPISALAACHSCQQRASDATVLQVRNKREERVVMADQRWDEVATWRGDFHEDEGQERWGDVMYTSFSGMDSQDSKLVDVGVDVTVQVCGPRASPILSDTSHAVAPVLIVGAQRFCKQSGHCFACGKHLCHNKFLCDGDNVLGMKNARSQ